MNLSTQSRRLSRRELLAGAAALVTSRCASGSRRAAPSRDVDAHAFVQTVTGQLAAERLGTTLMHEHVLVDFIGAERVNPARYDRNEVVSAVLPHLRHARALGVDTLVECTPAYLGRDPHLLQRLSELSGLQILTNTGYYGAANDKHLPAHAFSESAERLAARWIREAERGIDGTTVRPAFMKIGVDGAPLSPVDRRLVEAAAITHLATGLPVASHTGSGAAALEQIDILQARGVSASAFIWVHAQSERDLAYHARVAARGAWVEFDSISPAALEQHVELVRRMNAQGLLGHVLVSHDAGWYRVGEPGGGEFRSYGTLFTAFLPALHAAGFSEADTRQLVVTNPRRALTPASASARVGLP